jgi:hypothetical protein
MAMRMVGAVPEFDGVDVAAFTQSVTQLPWAAGPFARGKRGFRCARAANDAQISARGAGKTRARTKEF